MLNIIIIIIKEKVQPTNKNSSSSQTKLNESSMVATDKTFVNIKTLATSKKQWSGRWQGGVHIYDVQQVQEKYECDFSSYKYISNSSMEDTNYAIKIHISFLIS